jgi:hypothetical protein
MKKIAGKIAMILILVMLANSFAGCTFMLPTIFAKSSLGELGYGILGFIIDFLILGLIIVSGRAEAPNETGIYLANAEDNPFTEYNSFYEKLNSLPEKERNSFMEKLNSLPEAKLASLVRLIAFLPKTEITSSNERINALTDKEFAYVVKKFTTLSEAELDMVIDDLHKRVNHQSEINNVAAVYYNPVYTYTPLRLQY